MRTYNILIFILIASCCTVNAQWIKMNQEHKILYKNVLDFYKENSRFRMISHAEIKNNPKNEDEYGKYIGKYFGEEYVNTPDYLEKYSFDTKVYDNQRVLTIFDHTANEFTLRKIQTGFNGKVYFRKDLERGGVSIKKSPYKRRFAATDLLRAIPGHIKNGNSMSFDIFDLFDLENEEKFANLHYKLSGDFLMLKTEYIRTLGSRYNKHHQVVLTYKKIGKNFRPLKYEKYDIKEIKDGERANPVKIWELEFDSYKDFPAIGMFPSVINGKSYRSFSLASKEELKFGPLYSEPLKNLVMEEIKLSIEKVEELKKSDLEFDQIFKSGVYINDEISGENYRLGEK